MEFYYSLKDPLVIAAIGLSLVIGGLFLKEAALYWRRITPKSVDCWFCQFQSQVSYEFRNSWVCPKCEQYNGFNKEGDYNKCIPYQYERKLNHFNYAQQTSRTGWFSKNKLCDRCNLKQQLKVQQLANFTPMNEKNYDKEVEHFQKQLEKGCELCSKCDMLVSKILLKLREELSLPKKLTTAISKINIRGERATYINIVLSLLLTVSFFPWNSYVSFEVKQFLYNYTISYHLEEQIIFVSSHPWTLAILEYYVQILIGTGVLVNSIGFYQTNNTAIFFNVLSWILMFFLTLYPSGYEAVINILKVVSSIISTSISSLILIKNRRIKNKKKPTIWEKKNYNKMSSFLPPSNFNSRLPSPVSANSSTNLLSSTSPIVWDDSPVSISSGISNLSLGVRKRKELKKPGSKPVLTPPKFNPFTNGLKTSPTERNYHLFGKPSPTSSFTHYEPSLTPPSVYDGYETSEPITTIHSYGYPPQCFPCPSPSPTLAYYFSTQHFPKMLTPPVSPILSEGLKQGKSFNWMIIFSLPVIFLAICNVVLLYTVYFAQKEVPRT